MKPKRSLLTLACILVSCFYAFSQNNTSFDPFAKGKNSFTLQRNFVYGNYKYYDEDGNKTSSANQFRLMGDYTKYIGKGFGVGLRYNFNSTNYEYTNIEDKNTDWKIGPTLTYGKHFSDKFNGYLSLGVGFGQEKETYKTSTSTTTDKGDVFGYGATLGFPIQIGKSATFLVPQLKYDYEHIEYDNQTDKDSKFFLGLRLESYLDCAEVMLGKKNVSLDDGMFNKGSQYLGYYSKLQFSTGTSKSEYTSGSTVITQEDKVSASHLMGDYVYFPANNFGVGTSIRFSNDVQKSNDNDIKYTNTVFSFDPKILYHIPVKGCLNNAYLQVNGEFGSQKDEYTYTGNTTTDKYSTSGFAAGIGYDYFFSKKLAANLYLGYEWLTQKDKSNDEKTKERGFYSTGGVKYFFRAQRNY